MALSDRPRLGGEYATEKGTEHCGGVVIAVRGKSSNSDKDMAHRADTERSLEQIFMF